MLDLLKDCCNCSLLSLVKKHLNEPINVLQFFISYWKKFQKLIKFITRSYLSLLNSFLFLSIFYVSLKSPNNCFFRRFAYKSLLYWFSVLINHIMCSSNHFSTSSCFSRFSGSRFFRVQVFPGPRFLGSGPRIRVQVLEVAFPSFICYSKYFFNHLYLNWRFQYKHFTINF